MSPQLMIKRSKTQGFASSSNPLKQTSAVSPGLIYNNTEVGAAQVNAFSSYQEVADQVSKYPAR